MNKILNHYQKLISLLFIAYIFNTFIIYAQEPDYYLEKYINKAWTIKTNETNSSSFVIQFGSDAKIPADSFFSKFKNELRFSSNDKYNLIRKDRDGIGFEHYRYQQLFKDVPVEGGEFLLHEKKGYLMSVNGYFYGGINLDINPSLSKEEALNRAYYEINKEANNIESKMDSRFRGNDNDTDSRFRWNDNDMDSRFRWNDNDTDSRFRWNDNDTDSRFRGNDSNYNMTAGSLVISPIMYDNSKIKEFKLCWKLRILSLVPSSNIDIYIDAQSGEIHKNISRMNYYDTIGVAETLYSGTKDITTDYDSSEFRLKDNTRNYETHNASGIKTSDINNVIDSPIYYDNDNIWSNPADKAAFEGHWALGKVIDFYRENLGRNGFDNEGGLVKLIIKYDFNSNGISIPGGNKNGQWTGKPYSTIFCGDGDGGITSNDYVSLDIIGHEFTHGVVETTAGLLYQNESGALNESFADIMGTCAEFYTIGNNPYLFKLGEQTSVPIYSDYIVPLDNPKLKWQPDTYKGQNWVNFNNKPGVTNDWGGVHTNKGVQNFWFYLLCVGGSPLSPNDITANYDIKAIGIEKTMKIAYRNLAYYLTSNSTFTDSREGSLLATIDLYGQGSEYNSVMDAWNAVGVGAGSTQYCGGSIRLSAPSGTFDDGSGNNNYQNNSFCFWFIEPSEASSITLTFKEFKTEANHDSVFVLAIDKFTKAGKLLNTFSGNTIPPPITSNTGTMAVFFKSDAIITDSGWSASYTSTPNYCSGVITNTNPIDTISDGSGNNDYNNYLRCIWNIKPPDATYIELKFLEFSLEEKDTLYIFDVEQQSYIGQFTGDIIPSKLQIKSGNVAILFTTDSAGTSSGWKIAYSSSPINSIQELQHVSDFSITPNPASDYINISNFAGDVKIFDMIGRDVMTINICNNQNINVSMLQTGIYIIRAENKAFKFVKL